MPLKSPWLSGIFLNRQIQHEKYGNPFLKRWKTEHQGEIAQAEAGLPPSLVAAVKGLHQHMQAEFDQRAAQMQQQHADALRAAAEREQRLSSEREAAIAAQNASADELTRARDALAQLQENHHAQSVTLATIQADNAGLEQRLADRANEIATLDHQLTQARTQFEHYQDATAMQRTEERQAYERHIARLEQDQTGVQRHVAAQQATLGQQEATITHLTAERERHEQALRAAQEELATTSLARDRLAGRLEDETVAKERAATRLDTLQQQLADVRAELAGKMRETEMLGEQLCCAEGRTDKLAEEKLTWLQERGALQHRAQSAELKIAALSGTADNHEL